MWCFALIYFKQWDVVYSVAGDVAYKLFISSGSDPGPPLPVTHLSEIINSTQHYSHASPQEEDKKS